MTGVALTGAALVAAAVLATGLATRPLLRRLPEPADGAGKTAYADLATPGCTVGCALLSGLAATAGWLARPVAEQPLWWVLATLGVLLAAVDARTTWLPLRLTRLAWAAMAGAGLAALALGVGWPALIRAGVGAGVAGLLYWAVWRLSRGGFGFGDVRFAPLIGAPAAVGSWSLLVGALFLGSVLGAAYGLVRLARGRRGPFPYAPAMLAGAYLACGISATGWGIPVPPST